MDELLIETADLALRLPLLVAIRICSVVIYNIIIVERRMVKSLPIKNVMHQERSSKYNNIVRPNSSHMWTFVEPFGAVSCISRVLTSMTGTDSV